MRVEQSTTALVNALQQWDVTDYERTESYITLLRDLKPILTPLLTRIVCQEGAQKAEIMTRVTFSYQTDEGVRSPPMKSNILPIASPAQIRSVLDDLCDNLVKNIGGHHRLKSGVQYISMNSNEDVWSRSSHKAPRLADEYWESRMISRMFSARVLERTSRNNASTSVFERIEGVLCDVRDQESSFRLLYSSNRKYNSRVI